MNFRRRKSLEPTFGGINLEDIAAPECFIIEETLKKEMKIPVFHDDQHGTAIISGAALLQRLRDHQDAIPSDKSLVFNGAGAAAISCARIFLAVGRKPENILMCDSKGVVYKGRTKGMNKYKEELPCIPNPALSPKLLKEPTVFIGLCVANALTGDMLKGDGRKTDGFRHGQPRSRNRPRCSADKFARIASSPPAVQDYPNQVNNVLGFPFIFRGALDIRATQINEEMKLAAVQLWPNWRAKTCLRVFRRPTRQSDSSFWSRYIIPKPSIIACCSKSRRPSPKRRWIRCRAKAHRGVFEPMPTNLRPYKVARGFIRTYINKVKSKAKKKDEDVPLIVFPEGRSTKVLKALNMLRNERVCRPILLGYEDQIRQDSRSGS